MNGPKRTFLLRLASFHRELAILLFAWLVCITGNTSETDLTIDEPDLATSILLLPIDFDMGKLPASGVPELIPKWSEAAKASLRESFKRWTETHDEFNFVAMPALDSSQQLLLDEYLSLNRTVSMSAINALMSYETKWRHKRTAFDYGIGPGLNFLKDLSGADKALFVGGYHVRASEGRWATVIGLALLGVQAPLGNSVMIVGTLDLESGRLTWLNPQVGMSGDPRVPDDAYKILKQLLDVYPGGSFFSRVVLAP